MAAGLTPGLSQLYERLLVHDARRRLPGDETDEAAPILPEEIARLMGAASRLAFAKDHAERTVAYEIATRAAAMAGRELPGLIRAAEVVLARLGNFPGCELLHTRFEHAAVRDPLLRLEMRARE